MPQPSLSCFFGTGSRPSIVHRGSFIYLFCSLPVCPWAAQVSVLRDVHGQPLLPAAGRHVRGHRPQGLVGGTAVHLPRYDTHTHTWCEPCYTQETTAHHLCLIIHRFHMRHGTNATTMNQATKKKQTNQNK